MTASRVEHLAEGVSLYLGDCMLALQEIEPNSIDACVCDPPYGLEFMGVAWDTFSDRPKGKPRTRNEWNDFGSREHPRNASEQAGIARNKNVAFGAFSIAWAREVFRVLKPGAHLLAFCGTRTYHRMACGIEDAGFEIRDCIQWLYGSGFPKSLDVSKAIDKSRAGLKFDEIREHLGRTIKRTSITHGRIKRHLGYPADSGVVSHWVGSSQPGVPSWRDWQKMKELLPLGDTFDDIIRTAEREKIADGVSGIGAAFADGEWSDGAPNQSFDITAPSTFQARQWAGFGTALKPACEPIVLARKPLSEGTVAANVLRWGCGALNIDGCRVETDDALGGGMVSMGRPKASEGWDRPWMHDPAVTEVKKGESAEKVAHAQSLGRWPANIIHDGSDEVVGAFPDAPGQGGSVSGGEPSSLIANCYGERSRKPSEHPRTDSGSAARFFYTAKADADDRLGSKHPTVKPVDLMQWLVRLVTPPKGLVLDCFAGTGTTGEAALREGKRAVLIEREAEYQDDIRRRMRLAMAGPDERAREAIKQRLKGKPVDNGPLFGPLPEASGGGGTPAVGARASSLSPSIRPDHRTTRAQEVTE